MLLLRYDQLPDDSSRWEYELKLDGYRAVAFKRGGKVHLRSRNDNDFAERYPTVLHGLTRLPDDTVIDGELVAFGDDGRPSFNAMQNAGAASTIVYYVFDVMVLRGRDVMRETLDARRTLLERHVVPRLSEPVRYTGELNANLHDLIASVKSHGLEGLVAKRRNSPYEPGLRSGAWRKMRINRGQEFVVGGYTIGTKTFDALILGYYDGDRLMYVARDHDMPVRQLARSAKRAVGTRTDEGQDDRVSLAQASLRRAGRVPRMDGGQPSTPHAICRTARR